MFIFNSKELVSYFLKEKHEMKEGYVDAGYKQRGFLLKMDKGEDLSLRSFKYTENGDSVIQQKLF